MATTLNFQTTADGLRLTDPFTDEHVATIEYDVHADSYNWQCVTASGERLLPLCKTMEAAEFVALAHQANRLA